MQPAAPLSEKDHFGFIDGLRGMAVLWVLLNHSAYFFELRNPWLEPFWGHGFFGVNFFFVVSGFLITGLMMDFLRGGLDIRRFYLRRCFKIIPHYYFITLAVFIPLFCSIPFTTWPDVWRGLVPYLFFLQNYFPGASWLDHTWSLVTEEQFYIFWSVFLFGLSIYLRDENGRWRAAMLGAVVLVVLITINRFFLYANGASLTGIFPMQTHPTHGTSVIADGLMAGCALRLLWARYPAYFMDKKRGLAFYLLGGIAFLTLLLSPLAGSGVPKLWHTLTFAWIAPVCFIAAGLGGTVWLWQARWLREVGRNSYGIYLVHYPLLLWMADGGRIGYLPFLFYIPLAVFLGFFTTATVEKYFLDIRKKVSP